MSNCLYLNILNLEIEADNLEEVKRIIAEISSLISVYFGRHTKLIGSHNLSEVDVVDVFPDQLEMKEIRDA